MPNHGDTVSQRDMVLVFYFNRLQPFLIQKYEIDFFAWFALPVKEIRCQRSEVRGRRTEVRRQMTDVGGHPGGRAES
ncbi:MAG: hypothetical protein SRB2_02735 [Desulfobacteraceae bacterium Eth-SRB2]|nr:MAG: hypothetical protein SRB2_02735 [Desulfobacteraceae bacterium Eth-SRB2]